MMSPEEYKNKVEARAARLFARADKAAAESESAYAQARKMASVIPLGQPVLVGHHSEKSDRRFRDRIGRKFDKGYELYKQAQELRQRAEAAASNTAIFGDDPQAIEKIGGRVAQLEARQKMMVEANKLIRKNDRAGLAQMGFSESAIDGLMTPDYMGRVGFPDYALQNNNANIRRLKGRAKSLEALAAVPTSEQELPGNVQLIDNAEANRLQVIFPGKPGPEIREALKRAGFRWAPSNNAWQAYRKQWNKDQAIQIVNKFYGPESK